MDRDNIGSYFKRRLQGQTEEIDSNELIKSLGILQKEKKKNHKYLFFWIFGLGVIIGFAFLLLKSPMVHEQKNLATIQKKTSAPTKKLKMLEKSTEAKKSNEISASEYDQFDQENKSIIESQIFRQSNLSHIDKNKKTSAVGQSKFEDGLEQIVIADLLTIKGNEIHEFNTDNRLLDQSKNTGSQHVNNKTSPFNSDPDDTKSNKLDSEIVNQEDNVSQVKKGKQAKQKDSIKEDYENPNVKITEKERTTQSEETKLKDFKLANHTASNSIALYSGILFASKSLNPIGDSIQAHIDFRNATETTLEAVQFGVESQWILSKRFFAKIGFEYTQINERFITNYRIKDSIQTSVLLPYRENILSDGQSEFVTAPVNVFKTYQYNWNNFNHHKFYSIPISIGATFKYSKFLYALDLGATISYYQGFYGQMIDATNKFAVTKSPYIKQQWNLGFRFHAGVGYPVGSKMELWVRTSSQFQSYQTGDLDYLNQSYRLLGGHFVLKYRFE